MFGFMMWCYSPCQCLFSCDRLVGSIQSQSILVLVFYHVCGTPFACCQASISPIFEIQQPFWDGAKWSLSFELLILLFYWIYKKFNICIKHIMHKFHSRVISIFMFLDYYLQLTSESLHPPHFFAFSSAKEACKIQQEACHLCSN